MTDIPLHVLQAGAIIQGRGDVKERGELTRLRAPRFDPPRRRD